MENQRIIQVEDKVPFNLLVPLSIQHMFAMFGASILVPFIFGINPAVVLFMNGVGTLLFIGVTKGKAPAYLGSSFAFLAPAGVVISNFGYEYALGGFVAVGFCGCILAFIVYKFGTEWIEVVLPPAAMGPVVALMDWSSPVQQPAMQGFWTRCWTPERQSCLFLPWELLYLVPSCSESSSRLSLSS